MTLSFENAADHYAFTESTLEISLANTPCSVKNWVDTSSVTCDLETNDDGTPMLEAGSFTPKIHISGFGFVKIDAGVTNFDVPLVLTSFSPA